MLPTTISALTVRPVERTDLPKIAILLEICEAIDRLDVNRSLEELEQSFDYEPPETSRGWSLWEDAEGHVVAYGFYGVRDREERDSAYLHIVVRPDYREGSLPDDILYWCEQGIAQLTPDATLWAGARDTFRFDVELYKRNGYEVVRQFGRMQRSLLTPFPAPQFPEGFVVRTSQGETDAECWVEMYNQTFIDHWEFHPMTVEVYKARLQRPIYQPDLDWVAIAPEGTFAAFATCGIAEKANVRTGRQEGWVNILGTRRGFRRQGLGRAMLLTGMQALKNSGMTTALLGVDADNQNQARKLYESVGFEWVHTFLSYKKQLE